MKPGYHDIYTRYRDNITRGVLKLAIRCPPFAYWPKSSRWRAKPSKRRMLF